MEPKMEDVFALYEQKVAPLSSAQKEKLLAARDEGMTPFVIGCAILRAKQEQRRRRLSGKNMHVSFNYIYRIIEDWLLHGITTDERFRAYWSAISEDQKKNGGKQPMALKIKSRRRVSSSVPRGRTAAFSFLDD